MEPEGLSRGEFLRRSALAGGLLAGGGLLASCGGDEAATTTEGGGGTTAAAGGATTEAGPAPKKGGVLRVGLGGGGSNDQIDVAKATNQADFARSPMLYEGLFEVDPDMKLIPRLAEEAEPNAAGDEWTVRLREGVEFHNGKTLTADDLVYSIERNFDPDVGYTYSRCRSRRSASTSRTASRKWTTGRSASSSRSPSRSSASSSTST